MENVDHIWQELTLESAKFILEQAEKRLQATLDVSCELTQQAVNIMQFSIPSSLIVLGLIIVESRTELRVLYLGVLAVLTLISYMTLSVYDTYDIEPHGDKPSELLSANLPLLSNARQFHALVFSVIQTVERAIEANESENQKRQRVLFLTMVVVKFLVPLASAYIAMDSLVQ